MPRTSHHRIRAECDSATLFIGLISRATSFLWDGVRSSPARWRRASSRTVSSSNRSVSGYYAFILIPQFYERESQGENFPADWKEQRSSPCSPAHVMLGGSGFFFLAGSSG